MESWDFEITVSYWFPRLVKKVKYSYLDFESSGEYFRMVLLQIVSRLVSKDFV
jgi:hypothetical protein